MSGVAMAYYLVIFAAGFAGSFHCVGMCGGFACALGASMAGERPTIVKHLLYNSGRVTTYVFLGGLAGTLGAGLSAAHAAHGQALLASDYVLSLAQRLLSVIAGLLMLVMALQLLGYLGSRHAVVGGFGAAGLTTALGRLVRAQGAAAPLALGVANGFLPCPLVYAFTLQAAVAGTPLSGMLTMLAFGLGTFPAMLLMGGIGRLFAPAWRRYSVRAAAGFIVLIGVITLARALLPVSSMHVHLP